MRIYFARSHRVLSSGIEVEGTWGGVQWLALGLLALLPIVARSPFGLLLVTIGALVVYVFPARRRVRVDMAKGSVRIEHAGFFREAWTREIRLDEIDRWVLQKAGRKGGQPVFAAFARLGSERLYLFSHVGDGATALLDEALTKTLTDAPSSGSFRRR